MRRISPAFSHINLERKRDTDSKKKWGIPMKPDVILASAPMKVDSYDELVNAVAQISYYNPNLNLFFRGQHSDYKQNRKTTLLPSIYRKRPGERSVPVGKRFESLIAKSAALERLLASRATKLAGAHLLYKYQELKWAILQHYEVCPTPLLDITHSLHVACSFAFDKNTQHTGIVYLIGMPFLADPIQYNTYEELLNIRLLSICPPEAKRPFFQEGYLVGPFPAYKLDIASRKGQFDLARRLVAKFEIPIKDSFWGDGFSKIPSEKLYPNEDLLMELCSGLR